MLITGSWGKGKTFKMIPVSPDSPYNEAIYDIDTKVLALIGKEKKQSMHMIAKLDDNGDVKRMRIGNRPNGKDYAEERKTLETYYEYYVDEPNEIRTLINMFCINADSFDYNQYLQEKPVPEPSGLITV